MYKIKSVEKKEGSIVEIIVEIPKEDIEAKWQEAVKEISEHVSIDGFRKGHVPEKMLVEKVGELSVLEESASLAIKEAIPNIILEKSLKIISYPNTLITKIAKGEAVEATISAVVAPEFSLPDYKKIAKKIMARKEEAEEVKDEEVQSVLEDLKKSRKANGEPEEIDDEFVKKLGEFKDVDDFKVKFKENIKREKEIRLVEKRRIDTIEEIRKSTKMDVPEIMIEGELDRMMNEFSHRLSGIGRTFEEYKKDINKSEEDIRKEWKEKAKERVENELILIEIGKIEKIVPKQEDVDHEMHHMKEHYPGTDESRLKAFVEEILSKEEVFKFFEAQK